MKVCEAKASIGVWTEFSQTKSSSSDHGCWSVSMITPTLVRNPCGIEEGFWNIGCRYFEVMAPCEAGYLRRVGSTLQCLQSMELRIGCGVPSSLCSVPRWAFQPRWGLRSPCVRLPASAGWTGWLRRTRTPWLACRWGCVRPSAAGWLATSHEVLRRRRGPGRFHASLGGTKPVFRLPRRTLSSRSLLFLLIHVAQSCTWELHATGCMQGVSITQARRNWYQG